MRIKDIFSKNLFRPINGVVKADQQDDSIVWQELDEYVVTRELSDYFRRFFDAYLAAMDNPKDPAITSQMGVWVSGFFGSGKSHFIKLLSYLLANRTTINPDTNEDRKAISFFETKIDEDPMLLGDIKRGVASDTDVILFNIDSKADQKEGRDAILRVFLRVFNEMQGFCGEAPHIAEMERYLLSKGVLESFHKAFKDSSGEDWLLERDAYLLMKDEVVKALSQALDKSQESASEWFEKAEKSHILNIEKFASQVNEYLASKGPNHRIIFLVDEMGQFIGSDTHLMLNLQTITEDLGRMCVGRAWVVVTSQEDIDKVLGEVKGSKANDFSKIQGRFNTRLSLSSSNTDEVIQRRLLSKTDAASKELGMLFEKKGEIIKHQLSFTGGATLERYREKNDFIVNYPFAPYQFQLVQKIFESIRQAGATGLHLSRGERSMLDAFQSAAKSVSDKDIGALVPLYEFYPSIESFLDTTVKKTVDQAKDNRSLTHFDVQLLRTLFLIRYVDIIKSNIDNLVTLFIDGVDADRLEIRREIQESLVRLEKETLISRNGDLYFFLTNEERDVGREIKNVDIAASDEAKLLSTIIYDDVLKNENKYRYPANRSDYSLNRMCDGHPHGRVDQDLTIEVITPLNDDFSNYDNSQCIMRSTEDNGKALIKLTDKKELGFELRTYLQVEKYIRLKSDASAPDSLKKILRDKADENGTRRARLIEMLETLLIEADYFALGQTLPLNFTSARPVLHDLARYVVENTFTKLNYLKSLQDEPQKEIRAVLMTNDIGQYVIKLEGTEGNAQALREVKQFIDLSTSKNHRIALSELVDRFKGRPYGWPEWETVLLVTRLFVAGEIVLAMDGGALEPKQAVEPLTKSAKWKLVTILKRKAVGAEELKVASNACQKIFSRIGPDSEDALYAFIHERLTSWSDKLKEYKPLADTENYPGKEEIDGALSVLGRVLSISDSYEFFKTFNEDKEALASLSENIHELDDFYADQKSTWERLRTVMAGSFGPNRQELVKDPDASKALARMDEILAAAKPYGMLREVDALIKNATTVNNALIKRAQDNSTAVLDGYISRISERLGECKASDDLRNKSLKPLQDIKKQIEQGQSIPGIFYFEAEAKEQFENSLSGIEEEEVKKGDGKAPSKPVTLVSPSALVTKSYLETEADVEAYLSTLRDSLISAVKKGRVRIQ